MAKLNSIGEIVLRLMITFMVCWQLIFLTFKEYRECIYDAADLETARNWMLLLLPFEVICVVYFTTTRLKLGTLESYE